MNKKKFNTEEEIKYLNEALDLALNRGLSWRDSAEYLTSKTGIQISHEGLRKIAKKVVDNGRPEQQPGD